MRKRPALPSGYRVPTSTDEAYSFGRAAARKHAGRVPHKVLLRDSQHPYPHSLYRAYRLGYEHERAVQRAAEVRAHARANTTQINGWLWRARHALRNRNARLACEAMLSALWLMGIETEGDTT